MSDGLTITHARLWEIALPLKTPFVISGGTLSVRRSLIIELMTGNGAAGYGESAPFELPFYSSETFDSARSLLINALLPRLVGRTIRDPAEADAVLRAGVRGNAFARAGAETAVWDLFANATQTTVLGLITQQLAALGVADPDRTPRATIACGVALGIPEDLSPSTLARWTREALAEGYQRVKIKVRPGWDREPVSVVQQTLREASREIPMCADANGAYEAERDRHALDALDAMGLLFLEQPLAHDDLVDHAELSRHMRTPVCLDESLRDARWGRQAIALGAATVWNIKVQRVGGLTEALRLYVLAVRHGIALWGGTMPESAVGARLMLALATLPRFVYPSDIEPSARWYGRGVDLLEMEMSAEGTMTAPREHGLASAGVGEVLAARGQLLWHS